MPHSGVRFTTGLVSVAVFVGIVMLAMTMFRGGFTDSVPVTVVSPRAGLVMNPDAKVQMRGVQVGRVASIESLPNGHAAIHLAMDPAQLQLIPENVEVDIAASTVFGAKFVELIPPTEPSLRSLAPGQTLEVGNVTVEMNTLFQQLTSVLSKIEPMKLSETLGAISSAFNGRGERMGVVLADMNSLLAEIDPSLENLRHDLAVAPGVLEGYADGAPDLVTTVDNATHLSELIVDEQESLDSFLVSMIGLADLGNDVVGGNRPALTRLLNLLVPTTDLTNRYNEALTCSLAGLVPLANIPPPPVPGVIVSTSFTAGVERYRYPSDLPKVAATGGPRCAEVGLPQLPFLFRPPFVVADVGTNPFKYGNQGLVLNADGLKEYLFGPLDGPPRNSAQIGQPG